MVDELFTIIPSLRYFRILIEFQKVLMPKTQNTENTESPSAIKLSTMANFANHMSTVEVLSIAF